MHLVKAHIIAPPSGRCGQSLLILFAECDGGGECGRRCAPLIGSAKLNGLDPELYLLHILRRIADHRVSQFGLLWLPEFWSFEAQQ